MSVSRSVKLFGTDEPVEDPPILRAGVLEATFDAGNLRYIRIAGREALRAVAFLARDRNWGTYNPKISNLQIDETPDSFSISYDAECRDADQALRYTARIEGRSDGSLDFEAEGEALTDFETNRTGFVVLHPLAGVVGAPVTVEHTDGSVRENRFPELVDPVCPIQDIRTLTHEIAPGLRLVCKMEGDGFEMEDHRNWMDASYKTYVRPLAKPWPYTIEKGARLTQRVTLALQGERPAEAANGREAAVEVSVGPATGQALPRFGLAAPARMLEDTLAIADRLRNAGPSFLVCHFDARQRHNVETMSTFKALGEAIGAELVLEAVIPCLDFADRPTDDPAVMRRDMDKVAKAASSAGVRFSKVAVSPACDLKCTLPGSVWPKAPDWADLMAAAREAFPDSEVGGGMFSYFTELNRKRPPANLLDFITHTGCPIVHAGDDVSMTETLEALPSIFKSVRAFAGGKPYWIFPTAISMRDNPYGAAPAENPDNVRQAMNRVDPRERGLIGAAWYAGYLAHAARAGLEAVTLGAAAGPSGIVAMSQPYAQPWFDTTKAAVRPAFHVFAGYAGLDGDVLETSSSDGRAVQALAVANGDATTLFLSNLTGREQTVRLEGVSGKGRALMLDETSFEDACRGPDWRGTAARIEINAESVALKPYAVAEIRYG